MVSLLTTWSSPGAPHRGGGLPFSKPGLHAETRDLNIEFIKKLEKVNRPAGNLNFLQSMPVSYETPLFSLLAWRKICLAATSGLFFTPATCTDTRLDEVESDMSYAGDLTPQESWDLLKADERAILLDVRTVEEWQSVGVPDLSEVGGNDRAFYIPWLTAAGQNQNFLQDVVSQLELSAEDDRPIVILCRSGRRSISAAEALTAAGFSRAYNILFGFEGELNPATGQNVGGWSVEQLPTKSWEE